MARRARHMAFALALCAPAFLGIPAHGAECLGVNYPENAAVGGTTLALNGMGIRKATFLAVKVYVAALYLPQKSGDGADILSSDRPWRLTLTFVRDVDASDIREAFEDGFKNAAGGNFAALKPRIDALNARVVDFKSGQHLAFTNEPGKGVSVDVNGAGGPAITGADFAATLLAIWIGSQPPNKDLKTGLLGGACA
jgi:chalcone isomerase-like protein